MIELEKIVIPLVLAIFSFLFWNLKKTIDARDKRLGRIEDDVHDIKETLPKDYVTKEDYKSDIKDLKDNVNYIKNFIMEKRNSSG